MKPQKMVTILILVCFLYIIFAQLDRSRSKSKYSHEQVLIDNRDISEAKPKYKALLDTAFDEGSKISTININTEKCDNLTVLGKLWGFLKYYHPAIAKGDINWDYELFRIMPKVINSISKAQRNKLLAEWISGLGAIKEKQEAPNIDKSKIKFMPDLEWIKNESELGKYVTALLDEIKMAKRNSMNYYLGFATGVGNPSFEHEKKYLRMSYPDAGFRLLSLFRYWNIIQYLFPYKNLIRDDWNQVLRDFIPEFVKSKNALEYRLAILKLIDKIQDTHANIWGYDRILSDYFGKYAVPCRISFIENKAVVTEIYSSIDSTIQLQIGDSIEKVNGISVDKIVKQKLPIYPASNHPTKLSHIARDLLRCNTESISITYKRSGQIKTDTAKCLPMGKNYSAISDIEKKSWKMLDDHIGYIYSGSIKISELSEIMKNFENCKGIIIDLRCYPSEFIIFSLSEYLMPVPIQFVKFSHTNFDMPGMFIFTEPLTAGKNNPEYFKGKVIILVNETTQSRAEYHSMAFRKAPKVIVMGSTTAGADGNVSQFYLPGGIFTMISGIGVYYPDGTETQGVGIVPDIEIKPTIKGIIEGRDEVHEKAIQEISNDK